MRKEKQILVTKMFKNGLYMGYATTSLDRKTNPWDGNTLTKEKVSGKAVAVTINQACSIKCDVTLVDL